MYLYSENYKKLMKETEDDINRWKDITCSWMRRINILKMPIYPKVMYCCSVAQPCVALCDSVDSSMPGFPVLHYLLEFIQTHVHWLAMLSNYFTLCCSLILLPSILCSNQSFFQWVSSLHQVAKVLELQLQHFFIYSFIFKIINSHQ